MAIFHPSTRVILPSHGKGPFFSSRGGAHGPLDPQASAQASLTCLDLIIRQRRDAFFLIDWPLGRFQSRNDREYTYIYMCVCVFLLNVYICIYSLVPASGTADHLN